MIWYWENSGIFGTLIRIPLIIINQIFLSLGVIYIVIVGFILYIVSESIQYTVSESPDSRSMQTILNVTGALFILGVLGVIILFVCIIGLIASCHANRTILIVYEVALFIAFIIHIVFFVILIVQFMEELKSENESFFIREILKEFVKDPSFYIITNVVALVLELFFFVAILFLIKRLSKNNQDNRTAAYSEIKMSDLSQHNTRLSL